MNNKVTIGRSKRSDIHIDQSWDTVSNDHAELMLEGDSLKFVDHSTNGTLINGQKVHNRAVEIFQGDRILLAGVYELNWNVINNYFPYRHRPTVARNVRGENYDSSRKTAIYQNDNGRNMQQSGRMTEQYNSENMNPRKPSLHDVHEQRENYGVANAYSQADIDKAIEKWNWGAFFCTWLWGVFHKIYWPLLIIVLAIIPYVGSVASLCLAVYLGYNGSRIAWENGGFHDFESFKRSQNNWAIGGFIWFVISLAYQIYMTNVVLTML
jgi:hypothetical protein